jgi:hypothetical protein
MSKIVVGKKFGRTKIRNWFAVAAQFRQAGPMRAASTYNRSDDRNEVLRELEEDDNDHENSMDCWD